MISFEHRVLSEYRLKIAKVDTLANSIINHRNPKCQEAKDASEFLDLLVSEMDRFYEDNSSVLSNHGKRPHARSRLAESREWIENVERFYKNNPKRRRK
ncbi:MAG: hypothetical protein HKP31_07125 [Nitrosopumilus sp.]|nr:hypothetical protein [Nitrosopumilus sp.]